MNLSVEHIGLSANDPVLEQGHLAPVGDVDDQCPDGVGAVVDNPAICDRRFTF
jgi:hypothetical protein